jgi:hypothetical protein
MYVESISTKDERNKEGKKTSKSAITVENE